MIRNELRVNRAKRRREEWINHQVDELDESAKHDAAFRKGIYRGANSALHDFRGSPESGRKPLTPFTMPKTPDNMQKRMRATAQGETSTDKAFHKKIADVERKKDALKMKQGSSMHYTFTRNEMMRAQTQINHTRTGQDVFDGSMMANPDWRNVRKTLWVDKERPFRVFKADESLICNRSPA